MGMEGLPDLAEPAVRRWLIAFGFVMVGCIMAIVLLLSGCADPCQDNPRKMSCMSATELKHELGVK